MAEPLKNVFFTEAFFRDLATALAQVYPTFDARTFFAQLYDDAWQTRELKQRMRHATITLHALLPADYREALAILKAASAMLPQYGFDRMVFSDYVALYGLDDWEASLPALEYFTQQVSAEFAIRPFIAQDTARMMAQMQAWSRHDSPHVRRLASEGARPRLPWALAVPALKQDPAPILPILEQLKTDPSEDVRRSVANNLNDIAKDHPQVVIDTVRRWREHETEDMGRLIHHALRTLVKQGNAEALALLGYSSESSVSVHDLSITPSAVRVGEAISFAFVVEAHSTEPTNLMIDYVLHLAGANGKPRTKVFKLAKALLQPGERLSLSKRHSFKPITTRKYYPGAHAIEIQVNGVAAAKGEFMLVE